MDNQELYALHFTVYWQKRKEEFDPQVEVSVVGNAALQDVNLTAHVMMAAFQSLQSAIRDDLTSDYLSMPPDERADLEREYSILEGLIDATEFLVDDTEA